MAESDPRGVAFRELDDLLEKKQYRAAIKKADEILKVERGDVDALKCKAFALVNRGKFADVVSVASGATDEELRFLGAYAHYSLNHLADALKLISTAKRSEKSAVMELKGQILYKQGNFNQAKLTFEQCITHYQVNSLDVKTNLLATLVASGTSDEMDAMCKKYQISMEDGFEVTFNEACNHIAMGHIETAQEFLEAALRAGQESLLEDGYEPEEMEVELLPVTMQMTYLNAMTESSDGCLGELLKASEKSGVGASMRCVIDNNLLAAKSLQFSDHPPKRLLYESAKKLEKMLAASPVPLLSPSQSVVVGCNQALLLIALNHMDDVQPLVQQLLEDYPDHETVKMTHAVMLAKQNKLKEAAGILQEIVASHMELVLGPLLFRAQLLYMGGSVNAALGLLTGIEDENVKFMGSMVATKIALMEQASDLDGCCHLLDEALEWWRKQQSPQAATASTAIAWCLEKYAHIKLRQGDRAKAVEYCKEALEVEQDELRRYSLIAKLTRIVGSAEIERQPDCTSWLPEEPELEPEDVDDLEGNIKGTKRGEVSLKKRQQAIETDQVKKRKRKPRYPKGFDPENPGPMPDPERWLPKWQRSGYKKKQKGKKKDAVKGSQGAGKVDESLDRALHKSEPSTSRQSKPSGRTGPRKGHRK